MPSSSPKRQAQGSPCPHPARSAKRRGPRALIQPAARSAGVPVPSQPEARSAGFPVPLSPPRFRTRPRHYRGRSIGESSGPLSVHDVGDRSFQRLSIVDATSIPSLGPPSDSRSGRTAFQIRSQFVVQSTRAPGLQIAFDSTTGKRCRNDAMNVIRSTIDGMKVPAANPTARLDRLVNDLSLSDVQ